MNITSSKIARLLIYAVLLLLTVFGGSVSLISRLSAFVAWVCLLLMTPFVPVERQLAAVIALTLFMVIVCIAWTWLQVCPSAWLYLQQWTAVEGASFSSVARSAISIAPADSVQTLVVTLLPFEVFLVVLLSCTKDRNVTQLIIFCGVWGTLLALYGIIIYLAGNKWLLFSEKRFYLNDLTSVFVNRNTAANFFGIALSCLTALFFQRIQLTGSSHPSEAALRHDQPVLAGYAAAWLVVFLALMLTSSRAGAATALVSVVLISVVCLLGWKPSGSTYGSPRLSGMRAVIGAIGTLVLLTTVSGSQIFIRIQPTWSHDPRFCIIPSLFDLWSDNWLFGTGLGTFALAFPPYKAAECGLAELWLQAHNFYLEAVITFGLPAVALLAIFFVTLYRSFSHGLRYRRRYQWVSALGIGLLTQQLLHSALDFQIQNSAIASIFAALMAGCVRISSRRPVCETSLPR